MIRLNQLTTVNHLFGYPVFIPRNKFELSDIAQINDFATLSDTNCNATYAIDVVGVVETIEPVNVIQTHYGPRQFIRFTLYDGRKVTVWNQLLEDLDPILEDNVEHPHIVILADIIHSLEALDSSKSSWRIRVRVTRIWASISNDGNTFLGMNLILLDAQNYHVRAFVVPYVWEVLQNIFNEGNFYDINSFTTTQATGKLRSYVPDEIPTYAIDVAGVVKDIEPVSVIQTIIGDRYLLRFSLSDGRHSIKVVLSDDEILMLDPIRNGNFDNPPIIIFASCRAHIFEGNVILKCIQSSRIYIDPPYQGAIIMKQRLIDEGLYEEQKDYP
ncbi:hypothetical protein POM88_022055 [Heracleum sosnowskyi]|uniref:Replication protein A 70 kDa DNA-binding subunit B/D first OB fold domain-containing protein n=1 Tax=Heracleum sosnowskyi TaxID=360622 RepID=A0AAD8IEL5_9APIA|nr:hypothetical protein POM88_022055 [Heracleum sosnowskyi]